MRLGSIFCMLLSVLLSLSLFADDAQYFYLIRGNCQASDYPEGEQIGYLTSLSFPQVSMALENDIEVVNPEHPEDKQAIVGDISYISWEGSNCEELHLEVLLSQKNKAILQEALSSIGDDAYLDMEFVVYDKDVAEKKYFKRIYSLNKPMRFTFEPQSFYFGNIHSERKINPNFNDVITYSVDFSLFVDQDRTQEVGLTFRPEGKQFIKTFTPV